MRIHNYTLISAETFCTIYVAYAMSPFFVLPFKQLKLR